MCFLLCEGDTGVAGPQDAVPALRQNVAAFPVQRNSLHAVGLGIDLKAKFVSASRLFCSRETKQLFLTSMARGLVGHGDLDK